MKLQNRIKILDIQLKLFFLLVDCHQEIPLMLKYIQIIFAIYRFKNIIKIYVLNLTNLY